MLGICGGLLKIGGGHFVDGGNFLTFFNIIFVN
jgi:hypothetical protein